MEEFRVQSGGLTPELEAQLGRLLSSSYLVNSDRLRRFLRHSLERTVSGDLERLKETAIGVEIFGRPVGYDPKADSIVRVEAYRLRQKLAKYYDTDGVNDPIRITLNKGSYAAIIEPRVPEPDPLPLPSLPIPELPRRPVRPGGFPPSPAPLSSS